MTVPWRNDLGDVMVVTWKDRTMIQLDTVKKLGFRCQIDRSDMDLDSTEGYGCVSYIPLTAPITHSTQLQMAPDKMDRHDHSVTPLA